MRIISALVSLCMLWGCGRTSRDDAPGATNANAGADGQEESVGPIDVNGLAASLPMACPGRSETLAFQLPCAVGQNFIGPPDQPGYHVVECELAGAPGRVAVSFTLPLKDVPASLGIPVPLPLPHSPPPPPGLGVEIGGESFGGSLTGEITFEQVDLQGRAFVAFLEQGKVAWSGNLGDKFECSVLQGRLWAVSGWFI